DEAIAKEILGVVEPAAVEAAVLASEQETPAARRSYGSAAKRLGSGTLGCPPCWEQYDAMDPENRLVADELECRWNQALQKVREVELRIQQQGQSRKVAPATLGEFVNLAGELEAVWNHPDSDARLKK